VQTSRFKCREAVRALQSLRWILWKGGRAVQRLPVLGNGVCGLCRASGFFAHAFVADPRLTIRRSAGRLDDEEVAEIIEETIPEPPAETAEPS
jgi:hypothetical protein